MTEGVVVGASVGGEHTVNAQFEHCSLHRFPAAKSTRPVAEHLVDKLGICDYDGFAIRDPETVDRAELIGPRAQDGVEPRGVDLQEVAEHRQSPWTGQILHGA